MNDMITDMDSVTLNDCMALIIFTVSYKKL